MDFRIQACCPRSTGEFDGEDESIFDAIQSIFPMWTEDVIMIWNTVYIPLGYKYEISFMMDDILNILENLRNRVFGELTVQWASNTFANKWHLKWEGETIEVHSDWGSVIGGTEQLLSLVGNIILPKQSFVSEWKKVLGNVIIALRKSGYTEEKLNGMNRLIVEYNAINKEGILYT